jgi:hypothetical protein
MSVYRVTEVIGVSDESWVRQDVTIENGRLTAYASNSRLVISSTVATAFTLTSRLR